MTHNKSRAAFLSVLFFQIILFTSATAWGQLNPLALPQATLTVAVSASDTTLSVNSTAGFPAAGEVAIGIEVVSYSSLTPTSFVLSGRGQASTTAAAHDVGSAVTFFPVHAGLLMASIDNAVTSLTINSTTTFPPGSGSILIDQEILSYGGGSTTTLTGLTRGTQNTTSAAHNAGAIIVGRVVSPLTSIVTIPRLISASDSFSGIGLPNVSDGPANIVLNAYKSDGTALTVADANNNQVPVTKSFTVNAHHQFVGGIYDMFGDLGGATDFYATMSTGNPLVPGVVPIGNVDPNIGLNRLELAAIPSMPKTDLILPVALQNSAQYSYPVSLEIGIVGQAVPATVTADFVDATGNVVQETTLTPTSNQRLIKGLTDLFSNLSGQTIDSGYIHLSSATGFYAYEIVSVGKENAYFGAFPRQDAAPSMNIPVAISAGPYQTRLVITDGTAAVSGQTPVGTVTAQVTAYNFDGSLLSGGGVTNPVQVSFPVSGQYSKFVADILGLAPSQSFFGYLKVEVTPSSTSSGIVASALILRSTGNQLTAVPGQILPNTKLVLTPALFDPQITTALSLVNPNRTTVHSIVSVINGDGTLRESAAVDTPGQGQAIAVLSSLFPDIGIASDGYLIITSPLPIYGLMVFDNGIFLAAGSPIQQPEALLAYPNPMGLATPVDSTVPANASTYPLTVRIPNPAPPGGIQVNLHLQNSVIVSLSSPSVTIPEGQTSATVTVIAYVSGAAVIDITSPGFQPTSVVVNVQNVSDFTLSRNATISPLDPVVQSGGSVQFTLTYDTTNPPAVVWNVSGVQNGLNSIGTITQSGLYTAPLLMPTDQPVQVTVSATNANTTFFGASTTITVTPPPAP